MAKAPRRRSAISIPTIFVIALALAVGFVAGTRSHEIYAAIGPVFGIKVEAGTLDLTSVQRTYQALKANYDGELDEQALIDGASRGLTAAAGDRYTVFMNASEAADFDKDLSGDIGGGIGVELGVRSDKPTVVRVLENNPAKDAGLLAGDILIKVNDDMVLNWDTADIASKIRGEVGTSVKLTVLRDDKEKVFSITRATVNNPSVQSEIKDGVGILRLTRFDDSTASLARTAAETFKQKNVKSVVLDMRGNGGGYLTAAQDVTGIWLDDKIVVSERTGGAVTDTLRSGTDPILSGIKTVVLVDSETASASEIVAGALKDHGAATIVGKTTFGKGTVQKVLDLGAGTRLKVTVARWYTPNGKNLSEGGIVPDKTVDRTSDDVNAGRDPQLDAALKLVS